MNILCYVTEDFAKEKDTLQSNNRLLFNVLPCTLVWYLSLLSIKDYPNVAYCVT